VDVVVPPVDDVEPPVDDVTPPLEFCAPAAPPAVPPFEAPAPPDVPDVPIPPADDPATDGEPDAPASTFVADGASLDPHPYETLDARTRPHTVHARLMPMMSVSCFVPFVKRCDVS
jgi:hypothetical protein